MSDLFRNIRFYILVFSVVLSFTLNVIIVTTIPDGQLQTIRLNQIYGLVSVTYLYFALLAGPFVYMFPDFSWGKQYLKARRALGVSSFYFAALHGVIAFFGQLGGFTGISFLTTNYVLALSSSFIALIILFFQAITSFDAVIKKMTFPRWKILQRFVYVAGILVLIHMLLLGTHYQEISSLIPMITFVALAFLFFLEALRVDAFLQKKFSLNPQFNYASMILVSVIVLGGYFVFFPQQGAVSFGLHSKHLQQLEQQQSSGIESPLLASMQGDKTLRYTVGLEKPEQILPNQNTELKFVLYNATNGSPVNLYKKIYEKEAHLVVVNDELNYFEHIHPQRNGNTFTITTTFPKPGVYRAYLSYQPVGAVEQQVGFSMNVGSTDQILAQRSEQKVDTNTTKNFGKYEITLSMDKALNAKDMMLGNQTMTFTVKDAQTKKPVRTLKPYLGAFGHLVMIHQASYAYLHVHPLGVSFGPNANGGPEVTFMPMTLTDPIRPGVYRVFAEFNPDGQRIVADYTIDVK